MKSPLLYYHLADNRLLDFLSNVFPISALYISSSYIGDFFSSKWRICAWNKVISCILSEYSTIFISPFIGRRPITRFSEFYRSLLSLEAVGIKYTLSVDEFFFICYSFSRIIDVRLKLISFICPWSDSLYKPVAILISFLFRQVLFCTFILFIINFSVHFLL